MTLLHIRTGIPVALLLLLHLIPTALAFVGVVHQYSNSISTHNQMSSSSSSDDTKNNNDSIHWAIIGLGDVCVIKSGPAFYKSQGSTLSAVMRRTPNAAKKWIEANTYLPKDVLNSIKGYDNIKDMIHDMSSNGRKLDAIYISSPPGSHLENVCSICTAIDTLPSSSSSSSTNTNTNKIKAVYIEKPCGRCAWETNAMIDELKHRNIKFYPAYVSRAHERTQVLQKLLQDGTIGDKIKNVKYTQVGSSLARGLDDNGSSSDIPWRLNAEYSGGGLIMDMGCHVLDRFDYLFGPLLNVKSTALRKGRGESYPLVEDYVNMTATIDKCNWSPIKSEGANVDCTWDFSPPNKDESKEEIDELVITGNQGSVHTGMGAGKPIDILDTSGKVIKTIEFDAPLHAAQPLIQAVVNELRNVKEDGDEVKDDLVQSPARADNAVRTSEVLDSILSSYYGGRHDEYWRRADIWPGLSRGEEESS